MTGRQTDIQTDKQTDRQTDRKTYKWTYDGNKVMILCNSPFAPKLTK